MKCLVPPGSCSQVYCLASQPLHSATGLQTARLVSSPRSSGHGGTHSWSGTLTVPYRMSSAKEGYSPDSKRMSEDRLEHVLQDI